MYKRLNLKDIDNFRDKFKNYIEETYKIKHINVYITLNDNELITGTTNPVFFQSFLYFNTTSKIVISIYTNKDYLSSYSVNLTTLIEQCSTLVLSKFSTDFADFKYKLKFKDLLDFIIAIAHHYNYSLLLCSTIVYLPYIDNKEDNNKIVFLYKRQLNTLKFLLLQNGFKIQNTVLNTRSSNTIEIFTKHI